MTSKDTQSFKLQYQYDPILVDFTRNETQEPLQTNNEILVSQYLDGSEQSLSPTLIPTATSAPIQIPTRKPSKGLQLQMDSGERPGIARSVKSKRRGDQMEYKADAWKPEQDPNEIQRFYKAPVSSVPASFSSSSKAKAQKENGILRRASQSCRNKFQKASVSGKSGRRGSEVEVMDGMEGPVSPGEQAALPAMHHKNFLNRLTHTNRMFSKQSRYDTPQPINGAATARSLPVVPSSQDGHDFYHQPHLPIADSQLQLPSEPRGGDAARRSAAVHRSQTSQISQEHAEMRAQQAKRYRVGSLSSAADSGADLSSCGDVDMIDAPPADIRLDPLAYLPAELSTLIFSYLDAPALKACQAILPWKTLASDSLIWRADFFRKYQKESFVTPLPIQIGGVGVGTPGQPLQDWEAMHKAREQIDANWAAGRGRAVYMSGHTDSVYCVQFDEQKIITGSRDRTIRVWDLNTNRCVKVIGGPNVRPTPGPRVLRTVDYPYFHHAEPSVNGTPYGQQIYHVPSDFHSASILCLQYDEEILVTGSSDNDLLVWDVHTFEPIQRLKRHQGGVLDVAFDDQHIVSCSKDCTIIVWDRKTLKPLKTLVGHNGPVNAVQLRGNLLVSASGDGVARLWDLTKLECVREFPAKERGLAAVEFSDDAKFVLAGGNDHVTYKFEVATGAEVLQYAGHSQLVRSLFLDTQNKRVVSGSYDLDLRVYDYETGKLVTVFPEWTTSWMLAAKCDYRRIVSTSQDGRILLIDFGINHDGQKVPNVDLLRGCEPWVGGQVDKIYPSFGQLQQPRSS